MTIYHTNESNKKFMSVHIERAFHNKCNPVNVPDVPGYSANNTYNTYTAVNISSSNTVPGSLAELNPKKSKDRMIIDILGLNELYYQDM